MTAVFGRKLLKNVDSFLKNPDDHYEGLALADKINHILATQNNIPLEIRNKFEDKLTLLVGLGFDPNFDSNHVIGLTPEHQNYLKNFHFPVLVGEKGWILSQNMCGGLGYKLNKDYPYQKGHKEYIFPKGMSIDSGIIDFEVVSVDGKKIYLEQTENSEKDKFLKAHYLQNQFGPSFVGGNGWVDTSDFKREEETIIIGGLNFEIRNPHEVADFGHSMPRYTGWWNSSSENHRWFYWNGDFRVEKKISDTYFFAKVIEKNDHKKAAKIKYGIK